MRQALGLLSLSVFLLLVGSSPEAHAQLNCGSVSTNNKIYQELGTSNLTVGVNASTVMEDSVCPTTARVEAWVVGVGGPGDHTGRPIATLYLSRPVSAAGTYQSKGNHWVIWYPGLPIEMWNSAGNTQDQCEVYPREDPPPDPCWYGCPPADVCDENDAGYQLIDDCGCISCYSPIFIQLDGHRTEFSSAQDGVDFDMFGLGRTTRIAWPRTAGTAWLVLDRNHNRLVDNGTEMFGNSRWLALGRFARHGYEVLAELDQNGDGAISADDSAFGALLLWQDRNRDGQSSEDELSSLIAAGIRALSLDFKESRRVDRWGNHFRYRATVEFTSPPHRSFSWDVFLAATDAASTTAFSPESKGMTCGPRQPPDGARR